MHVDENLDNLKAQPKQACSWGPDAFCVAAGGHSMVCPCDEHKGQLCVNDPGCRGYKK